MWIRGLGTRLLVYKPQKALQNALASFLVALSAEESLDQMNFSSL